MLSNEYSKAVQALFELAQQGDRHSLDQFLTLLRPQILATCYRLLGNVDDAEDAAQEALISILAGINPAERLQTWQPLIFGSAVEASLLAISDRAEDQAQQKSPHAANGSAPMARQVEPWLTGHISLQDIDDLEDYPDRPVSTRASLALVFVNLLRLLQPEVRAVYVLADLLGCDAEVVARVTPLTPPQAAEHLAFARRVMNAARSKLPTDTMLPSNPIAEKILRRLGKALIAQDAMRAVSVFDLDAVLVIPGIGSFTGHEAIATQLARMFTVGLTPHEISIIEINAQPALVCFQKKEVHRRMRYFANLVIAAAISERAPHAKKIMRVDVVTEGKVMKKIGDAARRVKTRRSDAEI
jgi:RNA polymerase sigma-70 factor (ECF subfamily)